MFKVRQADVSPGQEVPHTHGGQQRQRRQQGAPGQLQEGRHQRHEEAIVIYCDILYKFV